MDNVLKLTVKKEVFDKLASGEQSYIYVDANSYWIRRLAVNSRDSFNKLKETQAFRKFDYVTVTCFKENAEYQFKSIRTGYEDMTQDGIDTGICIWITGNKDVVNEPEAESVSISIGEMSKEEAIETMSELIEEYKEDVTESETINEPNDEPINEDLDTDLTDIMTNKSTLNDSINFIIDVISGNDNVILVNRPYLIITSNGRIFGSKEKLNLNNDEEIKINVGVEKIYDDTDSDEEFINKIESYLIDYVKTGCVFIWKDGCSIVSTPTGRYLKMMMSKKMYLNR